MTASARSKTGPSSASTTADDDATTAAETEASMSADTEATPPHDPPAPTATAAVVDAPDPVPSVDPKVETVEQAAFRKGRVPIKLSHPISGIENYRRLRLDSDPDRPEPDLGYPVSATIWVVPDDARAVIMSGYAQVDPEDHAAVRAAVRGEAAPAATA